MDESKDQWKSGGDCNKCRRQPYCKKQCRMNRKLVESMITQAIREMTGIGAIEKALGGRKL